jgi:hypothetical protein
VAERVSEIPAPIRVDTEALQHLFPDLDRADIEYLADDARGLYDEHWQAMRKHLAEHPRPGLDDPALYLPWLNGALRAGDEALLRALQGRAQWYGE